MDPRAFLPPARVMIVAGKGGVGKTTVSAALAFLGAWAGLRTLLVEVEGRSDLASLFGSGSGLSYEETVLAAPGGLGPGSAELRARTITPDDALVEYLDDHGLHRVSKRLSSTGTLEVVATAVPGIKDILVLGKVKQLEAGRAGGSSDADFIVVDAPAAGHAVTFLASAYGLLDAAAVGPIRAQAQEVIALLGDGSRCQVMLVTLPEETPVNEAADTAYRLEDRAGVKLAPIVVNGVWPVLDLPDDPAEELAGWLDRLAEPEVEAACRAAVFRRQRQELQKAQMERLASILPLPQVRLPYLFTTQLGPAEIRALAGSLAEQLAVRA